MTLSEAGRTEYHHDAVVYRGDDEYVGALAPFVQEGVEHGEDVMVAVSPAKTRLLTDELGPDVAGAVRFVDMEQLGRNPAHILPAWVDFVGGATTPVRGIGEPIWAGRRPEEIVECQLHEALLNLAVDTTTPFLLKCPYDALALSDDILDESRHVHGLGPSLRPDGHLVRLFTSALPEPGPDHATETVWFRASDLRPVRNAVSQRAGAAELGYVRVHDLVLAVHEITTNSVLYGGGSGVLRMWDSADAFVVEVADVGHVTDPLAGRLPPDLEHTGGRGLWLAHQLCDLVQVRSSERGTTVRISTWH